MTLTIELTAHESKWLAKLLAARQGNDERAARADQYIANLIARKVAEQL